MESKLQSLSRVFLWQWISFCLNIFVIFVFTGRLFTAGMISLICLVVKLALQYGYERIFEKFRRKTPFA